MQLLRRVSDERHEALLARALAAGEKAAVNVVPKATFIRNSDFLTGEVGPVIDVLIHGDCGSSYVLIRDGRGSFARWLVRSGRARRHYTGRGVVLWAPERSQSLSRAMAFARAMAVVLTAEGLVVGVEDIID